MQRKSCVCLKVSLYKISAKVTRYQVEALSPDSSIGRRIRGNVHSGDLLRYRRIFLFMNQSSIHFKNVPAASHLIHSEPLRPNPNEGFGLKNGGKEKGRGFEAAPL